MSGGENARPALHVVHGDPTPEEVAVLTALVAAASAAASAAAPGARTRVRRGGWNDPSLQHRPALVPGPNAWRASSLPTSS